MRYGPVSPQTFTTARSADCVGAIGVGVRRIGGYTRENTRATATEGAARGSQRWSGKSPACLYGQRATRPAAGRIRTKHFMEIHYMDHSEFADFHGDCAKDARWMGVSYSEK